MGPILSALAQGYTHNQIITFLTRKYPQLKKPIDKALKHGFSLDKILKQIGGGRKEVMSEGVQTPTEKMHQRDIEKRENITKKTGQALLGLGAIGLGAGLAPQAARMSAGGGLMGEVLPATPGEQNIKEQMQLPSPQDMLQLPDQNKPNGPLPTPPISTTPSIASCSHPRRNES